MAKGKSVEGAGIAGMALVSALLPMLRAKRIISHREACDVIDAALLVLEELGPDEPAVSSARDRLEGLMAAIRSLPPARPK